MKPDKSFDEGYPDPRKNRYKWRVGFRRMAASTGFRTMYPSIIPPGSTHTHTISSFAGATDEDTMWGGAVLSALCSDFQLRAFVGSNILANNVENLACPPLDDLGGFALRKFLQLNCVTAVYAPLWESLTGEEWTAQTPLRNAWARREAQADIDVIVALLLGMSANELETLYRTQFPVMRRYDREDFYDAQGRKVPDNIARLERKLKPGDSLSWGERTYTHGQSGVSYAMQYPFKVFDYGDHISKAWGKYSHLQKFMSDNHGQVAA